MSFPLGAPLSRQVDFGSVLTTSWYQDQTGDSVAAGSSSRSSVTATASATPHTVGSYAEIVSSLSANVSGVYIQLATASNASAADSSTLINIAIGGAGSEVVIIPNIAVGYKVTINALGIFIPINISIGTRVSFNAQSVTGSKTITARFTFVYSRRKLMASPKQIDTYGANTATSAGVTISNPGSLNTKGSYTEITSATTRPLQGLFVTVQGAQSTSMGAGNVILDVAIGSAGNEIIIMQDYFILTSASEAADLIIPSLVMRHIPAGTRISARYARSATAPLDVIVHGIPY